jgi:hypothetical protein
MSGNESDAVFERIRNYLVARSVRRREIAGSSLLYHELGLRGDDAYQFMQFILREFDVDMTGFNFATYFRGEYYGLRDAIRDVFKVADKSRKPLSIGHIVSVCLAKKWADPST